MRITENRIASDFLFNVNRSRDRINQLQTALASGVRVQKPSDDPEAADTILRLNSSLDRNSQLSKNVADAQSTLDASASGLDSVANILAQVDTLLAQARNGAQAGNLGTFANSVDQLVDEAINIGNTKFNGKYIYSGTLTQTAPYTVTDNAAPPPSRTVTYNGNTGGISYFVAEGQTQPVNVNGQDAFGGPAIFTKLIAIADGLRAGTVPPAVDSTDVESMMNDVLAQASKLGSVLQSLDNTAVHLASQRNQLLSLRSVQQDTDVAEATLKLKNEQVHLDAALNTGAQIIPMSLIDFLK